MDCDISVQEMSWRGKTVFSSALSRITVFSADQAHQHIVVLWTLRPFGDFLCLCYTFITVLIGASESGHTVNRQLLILVMWLECRFLDTEVDGLNLGISMLRP